MIYGSSLIIVKCFFNDFHDLFVKFIFSHDLGSTIDLHSILLKFLDSFDDLTFNVVILSNSINVDIVIPW